MEGNNNMGNKKPPIIEDEKIKTFY